ncbi:MAG: tetratricopeptide repeat protein [Symploca sp. SIO2B6]|nr:tetratricopeptide repeat protein [Symploca sp. SIO2B6]
MKNPFDYDQLESSPSVDVQARLCALDYAKGAELAQLGQYAESIDYLDRAVEYGIDHYVIWTLRGEVLFYLGDYQDAIASCDQAIALCPHYAEAWQYRGLALHSLNQYRAACESYDKAAGCSPPSGLQAFFQRLAQFWQRNLLKPAPQQM